METGFDTTNPHALSAHALANMISRARAELLDDIPRTFITSTFSSIITALPSTLPDNNNGSRGPISQNHGKGVLVGLLAAMSSVMLILLIMSLVYFLRYTSHGRILLDRIGRPGEFDDEQQFAKDEAEALEEMDDIQRAEYMRAKAFVEANPPESAQTDISLSQFLAIQEKGVSAWEFEPALEIANCFVEGRTEIEIFDTECSVQTNLPVPKQNEVYYWEAKIYDKPDTTVIGIGFTTKPYPLFRMPGYHKTSLAYLSPGHRRLNQPFNPPAYGPPYVRGDVIGVGYRPRTGTVFFTRNGKKLDDATHSFKSPNLFPTVGASGPATIHVNFGQLGFVYIEANVKKWGLAPMTGSLAPPPPYGSEAGSILLDQGRVGVSEGQSDWGRHARSRSAQVRLARGTLQRSPGPVRSPTDISLAQLEFADEDGEYEAQTETGFTQRTDSLHARPINVPTGEGLGLVDSQAPPPEYSSPPRHSSSDKRPQGRRHDYFDDDADDDGSDSGEDGTDASTPRPTTALRADRSPPIPYEVAVAGDPPNSQDTSTSTPRSLSVFARNTDLGSVN